MQGAFGKNMEIPLNGRVFSFVKDEKGNRDGGAFGC